MSDEVFLSRGGDIEQKIQEALVGATFSWGFYHLVTAVKAQMAAIHKEALDIELRSNAGCLYSFEITAAHPPGYQIRLAYRGGKRPEISPRAFSGEPIPAEWLASAIINKTNKVRGKSLRRHLLVYNNISGGTNDLWRLPQLLLGSEKVWDSIWIITGVPDCGWIALVSNSAGLEIPMRERHLVAKGMTAFWGYWIDRSGFRLIDTTKGVRNE